jgi:succinate dehydrogenase / fumarate reductase cytochrome b subunit
MLSKQRPLSPHLQVYKPQLTSIMSVLHRFTGVGFIAAICLVCVWIYFLCQGELAYLDFCKFLNYPIIKLMLYGILACVYYHFLNGIRYLVWSLGRGYEINCVYRSGWLVTFMVLVLIILTVCFV